MVLFFKKIIIYIMLEIIILQLFKLWLIFYTNLKICKVYIVFQNSFKA